MAYTTTKAAVAALEINGAVAPTQQMTSRRMAGLMALMFGALMVFGTGLAGADIMHDAAHDSRHAYGFPCH